MFPLTKGKKEYREFHSTSKFFAKIVSDQNSYTFSCASISKTAILAAKNL